MSTRSRITSPIDCRVIPARVREVGGAVALVAQDREEEVVRRLDVGAAALVRAPDHVRLERLVRVVHESDQRLPIGFAP